MKISMSSPVIGPEDIQEVIDVLKTGQLSLGSRQQEFEKLTASYAGCKYAVGVNSGTSALHLAVIAAGIGAGDLVITTPFSFIASANCLLFEGAIPVFVDIDPVTYNIDPALAAQAAADLAAGGKAAESWLPLKMKGQVERHKLKAILTVDAFGQPADYDRIRPISDEYGLALIEDSCEALGSQYKGRMAGSLGDVGAFAYYPNKQITTAEGGMLVTDNEEWASLFYSLRNQGRDVFDAWLNHTRLGYNYRMDEMSAALGLTQMKRVEELLTRREIVARLYNKNLAEIEHLRLPMIMEYTTKMGWFVYVVQTKSMQIRNQLMEELKVRGIPSRPYFTPIHLQPFYREKFGYQRGDYPHTEHAGDCCLALPFSGAMTEEEVIYVSDAIKDILGS